MKTKLMIVILSACTFLTAHANDPQKKEELKADRDQVNTACAADAQTAGCAGKVVGEGLLKCLHAYKKEHKDFKISDSCKAARKELRSDRAEMKAEKEEKK